MPYTLDEETLMRLVRCPESAAELECFDSWLYSADEQLYPIICRTPILAPRIESFLRKETWSIARAMAEFGEEQEVRSWFFSRYGCLDEGGATPVDTEVAGEGYPGFWDCLQIPGFVTELVQQTPEQIVEDQISGTRFKMGLDLGCGQGGMMQRMAAHCDQVIGVEVNPYLAMLANRHLPATEIPIRYLVPEDGLSTEILAKPAVDNGRVICADVTALPFDEPLFDWIHCGHFLDLSDDPAALVADIAELLKPNGLLTITSPLDFSEEDHFEGMFGLLARDFQERFQLDGIPWLRFNHKRRYVLHEDWVWMGNLD